ncbi:MAG: hypothetical protein WBD40_07245 [Tepidisphaeraceae bacterium]
MADVEQPAKIIERLAAAYDAARDDEVLAAIASLPSLADETDARWDSDEYWRASAYPFLALAEVASKRRLKPAVRLLLERACYGDPGEIMRGMRHTFEAIYNPDWTSLADEYLALARAERLGTRLWAIDGLTVVEDARAVPVFETSVREDPEEIRWRAEIGLERLLHPEKIAAAAAQRQAEQERERHEQLARQAEADARITDRRCAACGKPMPSYRRTCKHCGVAAK